MIIDLKEILVIMEQHVIRHVQETIFYLIVFTTSVCILLHYYVLPQVKRAFSLNGSATSSGKLKREVKQSETYNRAVTRHKDTKRLLKDNKKSKQGLEEDEK